MTPAVEAAKKAGLVFRIHQYRHDPAHPSYGEEAAEKLDIDPARVFKTLVVKLDGRRLAVAVVPVSGLLDMKAAARALGGRRAEMAEAGEAQRATGYMLGGVSPLGQKRSLPTLIDESALTFETIFVSAGRRGLEMELKAQELAQSLNAGFAPVSR